MLLACADARRQHRVEQGAYVLSQPDVFPSVNAGTGAITFKRHSPAAAPGRLVAELMIAANAAAAQFCESRRIPMPFRGQRSLRPGPPPPAPDAPYDPLRSQEIIRCLDRTTVDTRPHPHTGLGLDAYVQVTSPVRRYVDLLGHRQLKAALTDAAPPYRSGALLRRCRECQQRAGEARQIETWARTYFLLKHLRDNVGAELHAVALRRLDDRVLVELTEFAHRTAFRPSRPVTMGEQLLLEVVDATPRDGRLELREAQD